MEIVDTVFLIKLENLDQLIFKSEEGCSPFKPILIETAQAKFFIRDTEVKKSQIKEIFVKYPKNKATIVVNGILAIKESNFIIIAQYIKFLVLPGVDGQRFDLTEISTSNLEFEDSRAFVFEGSDVPPEPEEVEVILDEENE